MLYRIRLKKDVETGGVLGYKTITVLAVEPQGISDVEDRCHSMGSSYQRGKMFKWAVTSYYTCLVDDEYITQIVDCDFWHDVDELGLYEPDHEWLASIATG